MAGTRSTWSLSEKHEMTHDFVMQLDQWLRENRPDLYQSLNPPAQECAFATFCAITGIVIPPDLKTLYLWRDGQSPSSAECIMSNRRFLSLMEVATTVQMLRDESTYNQWEPDHWQSTWVPFFSDSASSYICIATRTHADVRRGSILWFHHDFRMREVMHKNLDEFLNHFYIQLMSGQKVRG